MARLCFFDCIECGERVLTAGGNAHFICYACAPAEKRDPLGKQRAHSIVAAAIRAGELPPPFGCKCADCDSPATEYDHRDYNAPLSVDAVCRTCNRRRGPAIPIRGGLSGLVERGRVPYSLRFNAEKLLSSFGVRFDALASMPTKLTADHWRAILAQLPEGV